MQAALRLVPSSSITVSCQDCQITGNAAAHNALHLSLKKQAVGGTDSKGKCPHRQPPLLILVILCFLKYVVNSSCKQEAALRDVIAFAVKDHPEAS